MSNSNPSPGTRFKPGQSGNLKGRTKGVKNRSTVVKYWLKAGEVFVNPITEEEQKLTQEDIVTLAQITEAREGNTKAYNALMDSRYGKAVQRNEDKQKVIAEINVNIKKCQEL